MPKSECVLLFDFFFSVLLNEIAGSSGAESGVSG